MLDLEEPDGAIAKCLCRNACRCTVRLFWDVLNEFSMRHVSWLNRAPSITARKDW